ncbi:DUF2812 domain-containing protein [Paenibacillus silviterrae]|uniref:DUF2812 domain-containing protein n=1 Tax=Paenibacillus silviterrae TaxID=3242194 RepID=UPI0025429C8D|nr:DUF2812 domain-containing protein [Paenibacillus chinjuensis]
MKKYKFFSNFDEEERWLREMARQGCRFTRKTAFGYEFKPSEPENTTIKVDYRTFKRREDFEDYLALFEDSGWEHLSGTKSSGYQYFRKIDKQGSEEIFSDVDSKAGRYKRQSEMWAALAWTFTPIMVVFITNDTIHPEAILDPQSLYLTPGLWEMNGSDFWRAFLFETPFAFFRGFFWLFFPALIGIYAYFASKANRQYKKFKENQ